MTTQTANHPGHLRVIGAIAAKDISEGWRNKTLLGVAFGLLVTLLISQALPFLMGLSDRQPVILVAGPQSTLTEMLAARDDLSVSRRNAVRFASDEVGQQSGGVLGVVLTAEAEARLLAGETVTLEGMTPHATSDAQLGEAVASFQAAVAEATGGGQAEINVTTVYPGAGGGRPGMIVLSIVLVLLLIGLLMVPNLMLEEKEDRTLDVLMVSPATPFDVVAGKGLAGLVYGAIAAVIAALFYQAYIVHWGVAFLGALLTVSFGISLGLLLGILFDNSSTLNLWLSALLLVLMLPVFLKFAPRLAPLTDSALVAWMPTLAMDQVFRASMMDVVPLAETLWSVSAVVLAIAVLLALVVYALRRTTA